MTAQSKTSNDISAIVQATAYRRLHVKNQSSVAEDKAESASRQQRTEDPDTGTTCRSADGPATSVLSHTTPCLYDMKSGMHSAVNFSPAEEEVLQQVAQSGEVDDGAWPLLQDALISRLKQVTAPRSHLSPLITL
jgi:hypothetical protein